VGALFTNREGGGRFNRVFGTDVNLLFREYWSLEGWFARLQDSTTPGGADALFTRFAYETDLLGVSYRLLELDEAFLPGVGFVRRPGARENSGETRYSPRPGLSGVRQLGFRAWLGYITNSQNVLETRQRGAEFNTAFESGDTLSFEYANLYELLPLPFELRGDFVVPTGAYRTDAVAARLNTSRRRWLRGQLNVSRGGFWDGRRDTFSLRGDYRVSKHLELGGNYEADWR
jgi:hypothetical protein